MPKVCIGIVALVVAASPWSACSFSVNVKTCSPLRAAADQAICRARLPHNLFGSSVSKGKAKTGTELSLSSEEDDIDAWFSDFDPSQFDGPAMPVENGSSDRRGGSGGYERRGGFNNRQNGRSRGPNPFDPATGHDYVRDTYADDSRVDEAEVNRLIAERTQARKTGRFEEADAIRDTLLSDHGVNLRDKERQWRSGCSPSSGSGMNRWGDSRAGGRNRGPRSPRSFGPKGHDYNLSPGAGPNNSPLSEDQIDQLLAARLDSKLNRNFETADRILAELGQAGVNVHDGLKEWRADGERFANSDGYLPDRSDRRNRFTRNEQRQYTKSEDSLPVDGGPDAEAQIEELVAERTRAKQRRNYPVADDIRNTLREEYNVEVNDPMKMWSVGGIFGGEVFSAQRRTREDKFGPYKQSSRSEPVPDVDEIQELVTKRDQARSENDFSTADAIRDSLADRNIFIDDRLREWALNGAFTRAQPDSYTHRGTLGSLTEDDVADIEKLLMQRDIFKRTKEFSKADAIRDDLGARFEVKIDDKRREWHVLTADYAVSKDSAELDDETYAYVDAQVRRRAKAKLEKDFDLADAIRLELDDDYKVVIDDRIKEWKALPLDEDDIVSDASETESTASIGDEDGDDDGDDGVTMVDEDDDDDEDDEDDEYEFEDPVEASELENTNAVDDGDEDLDKKTVPVLKDMLRERGLPVSGKKAELIERLQT